MTSLKIESGVPLPPKTRQYKNTLFGWEGVKSGDSVFVKGLRTRTSLYASLWNQARRRGFRMVTRIETGGRRVWFLKEQ